MNETNIFSKIKERNGYNPKLPFFFYFFNFKINKNVHNKRIS